MKGFKLEIGTKNIERFQKISVFFYEIPFFGIKERNFWPNSIIF